MLEQELISRSKVEKVGLDVPAVGGDMDRNWLSDAIIQGVSKGGAGIINPGKRGAVEEILNREVQGDPSCSGDRGE